MPDQFTAEISPQLREVPAQGSAGAFNGLVSAVRGATPVRRDLGIAGASGRKPLGGALKRSVDLVVAGISVLVLAPVLVMVALLVLVTMGRPVLFAHPRVGFQRKLFNCHKFRSMVRDPDEVLRRHLAENPDAAREWEETQKLRNDPEFPSSTPVVMTTAGPASRSQRLDAYRAGVWEYLSLPVDAEALILKLSAFVRAKREIDRSREESLLDDSTGLYNVRGLARRAREMGAEASRRHSALACVAVTACSTCR